MPALALIHRHEAICEELSGRMRRMAEAALLGRCDGCSVMHECKIAVLAKLLICLCGTVG